jgi:ribosome assembly protein YihI (activator of Der GTPase)
MLGEFGVPIPDIHGKLNEEEQARWVDESLNLIQSLEEVVGLNYWVSHGGSTAIFNNDHSSKPAAKVLEKYFKRPVLL